MKSLPGVRSTYARVFSRTAIIATYVVIIDVHYTISMQVESIIITSIKVQKYEQMGKFYLENQQRL
jgi:hypothetical protein